jgi:hypothetical protein
MGAAVTCGALGAGKTCCGHVLWDSAIVPIIIEIQCTKSLCRPFNTAFICKVTKDEYCKICSY